MFVRDYVNGFQPLLFLESFMELVVFCVESLYFVGAYLSKIQLRRESYC